MDFGKKTIVCARNFSCIDELEPVFPKERQHIYSSKKREVVPVNEEHYKKSDESICGGGY